MAAFGSATLPALREPVLPDTPFSPATRSTYSFGSAVIGSGGEAPPSLIEGRVPGDYEALLALRELSTVREVLYEVPRDASSCVVRTVHFANSSGALRTVTLWAGGRVVHPGVALEASGAGAVKSEDYVAKLASGGRLEASADGAGVVVWITGIESVG